jgi:hypothetical protein
MPLVHRGEAYRAVVQSTEIVKGGFWGLKNDLSGGMVLPHGGAVFPGELCLLVSASEWL